MRTAGQGPGGFEKRDGSMKPGQDLVMAGYTGLAGTVKIWEEKREELLIHFPEGFFRSLGAVSYTHLPWQSVCPVIPLPTG